VSSTISRRYRLFSKGIPSHITDSKEEALRFAENARYQTRLASSLRRREEVMDGTVLVDRPFPDEPPLETIRDDLLIGDVETVAEKLVAEIRATHPVHVCFSFKVGNTEHKSAMPLDGVDDRQGQAAAN
jgi:alkanesulfonate monooxygenase SsuD/methylene tetrahydromethanopterin reductase-like flavin-dependent oxidoreductase (luciferase family)